MTKFTIEIYSDTLCPWCCIGKKFLDSAIATYTTQHPDAEFELTWRPFLLHPKARASGIPRRAYYKAKHGPGAEAFFHKVETIGDSLGIRFYWDGLSGSSFDSHKLILLAGQPQPSTSSSSLTPSPWSRQSPLLDRIFKGFFEEGRDISDRKFLVECAVEAGVGSEDEVLKALDSDELGRRVEEEDRGARYKGVEAVPSYLVQGRYFVGGMQRPEVFLELFGRVGGG